MKINVRTKKKRMKTKCVSLVSGMNGIEHLNSITYGFSYITKKKNLNLSLERYRKSTIFLGC